MSYYAIHQSIAFGCCRVKGISTPTFNIVSDRRGMSQSPGTFLKDAIHLYFGIGGRTAWSATVTIQGTNVAARYWYDGQFINNAKARAFFIYFGSTSNELSRRTPQKSQ